jgi:hypothetical protein
MKTQPVPPVEYHWYRVNKLVAMVTMENKKSKLTVEQGSPNKFEPQPF